MDDRIRLGISSCLLGEPVRYDGGHKLDRFLVQTLGRYVEYVPVCPEVEVGLPTPREALRLVDADGGQRLVFQKSGADITERMEAWARQRVEQLAGEDLCGFIFKSRSPSSGMARVKLYDRNGVPNQQGVGVFARIFMERFPLLPVEEEGRLHDPRLRENFIDSIFTFKRWRDQVLSAPQAAALVEFHTCHKLLLMAHSPAHYRQLGKLVAGAGRAEPDLLLEEYQAGLLAAMRLQATPSKHVNVLQHLLGYFKTQLSRDEKQEALELFERFRAGQLPLIVPVTLVNHFVRKYRQPYLLRQYYLQPHPIELQLRNHV